MVRLILMDEGRYVLLFKVYLQGILARNGSLGIVFKPPLVLTVKRSLYISVEVSNDEHFDVNRLPILIHRLQNQAIYQADLTVHAHVTCAARRISEQRTCVVQRGTGVRAQCKTAVLQDTEIPRCSCPGVREHHR